jgi:hypothetical protein
VRRPRPWGQGTQSASHPCLRFSSRPRGGRSPGNSSGWLLSTAGERRLAPAPGRVAGGGSAVTLQRDAAEVHACRRAARAYRREPGHGRARQPAEHRSPSVRSAADRARGCRRFAVRCHYQSDSPEFTGATRETVASAVLCSLAGRGVGFVAGTRAVVDAMSSVSTGAVSIIGGGGRGASR